jgi:hypothetical protein
MEVSLRKCLLDVREQRISERFIVAAAFAGNSDMHGVMKLVVPVRVKKPMAVAAISEQIGAVCRVLDNKMDVPIREPYTNRL